jgi:hypothetical protein
MLIGALNVLLSAKPVATISSKYSQGNNMAGRECCVETVRSGDNYYLLDAKDFSLGPVAVLSAATYRERYDAVQTTHEPTMMFDSPEQPGGFGSGEMEAYARYLASGVLAELVEHRPVTAYENMRDLQVA